MTWPVMRVARRSTRQTRSSPRREPSPSLTLEDLHPEAAPVPAELVYPRSGLGDGSLVARRERPRAGGEHQVREPFGRVVHGDSATVEIVARHTAELCGEVVAMTRGLIVVGVHAETELDPQVERDVVGEARVLDVLQPQPVGFARSRAQRDARGSL